MARKISGILHLIAIVAILAGATAVDYCNSQLCPRSAIHTMCKYSTPRPAERCSKVSKIGLTDAEKSAIVQIHNEMRQRVASGKETKGSNGPQPGAISMPDLTWDDELETIAQRWTNQCDPGHDVCRNVERYSVGQNMAQTWSSGENKSTVKDLIQMWYDEVKDFDKNQVEKLTNISKVGHYTQIVASRTIKIGCGSIEYKNSDNWNVRYFICNYGPIGNILQRPLYEIKK